MERCLICHRKLRDQESISRKIGPTCWSRLAKVTKQEKERKKARQEKLKFKALIAKGQVSVFDEIEKEQQYHGS